MIDQTHDPALLSWVAGADGHRDFPIQNLPLGMFSPPGEESRAGVAIGDMILDLSAAAPMLPEVAAGALRHTSLNALLALPSADRRALRSRLSALLSGSDQRARLERLLHPAAMCELHLPCVIGDYTDFYTGIHHATNVGRQFRPDTPLLPNYKWLPIGYHGRSSSIRPSGTPVIRPVGQFKPADTDRPMVGSSRKLDYELELGVWIGPGNALGAPIPIAEASSHVAGFCLLNDWSARDFQAWEYQPLGPFLGKSFQSTISPWIVTAEALAPFRLPQPARDPADPRPLPYLSDERDHQQGALALELEVWLSSAAMRTSGMSPMRLSRGPATNMYWTVAQLVAHHASNGCNLHPGDLLGTGAISTPEPGGYGSLMEITRGGAEPVSLPNGETRRFLEDGDEISLKASARAQGYVPIGFGACSAVIAPARI